MRVASAAVVVDVDVVVVVDVDGLGAALGPPRDPALQVE
jgi:hypothetical protein